MGEKEKMTFEEAQKLKTRSAMDAMAGLINTLNPEMIIIGGGLSNAGSFIFGPLKKELSKRAMKQHLKGLKIVRANFSEEAGIKGAASLVFKR